MRRAPTYLFRAATLLVLEGLTVTTASAESFDARYQATLAGLTVGGARVTGSVNAATYRVRFDGSLSLFGFSNRIDATAAGRARSDELLPDSYSLLVDGSRKRSVAVSFSGDRAVRAVIEPAPEPSDLQERWPMEPQHREGVLDPLSALVSQLLRATRTGDPCGGLSRVFSGQSRFDVALEASRSDKNEIVCRAIVRPIAGHRRSGGPAGGPPTIVIAFPASGNGALRLPDRIEFGLPVGSLVIRRMI